MMTVEIQAPQPLLPDIFALHAKWRAKKPALVDSRETLTWAQFDSHLNQIANGLLSNGLKHSDIVIVVMSNSNAMAETLFGIMKAGLVSAPLNVSVSDDAIKNMIGDSGAKAIITSAEHIDRVASILDQSPDNPVKTRICYGPEIDGWTNYEPWRSAQSKDMPNVNIAPDDLFNIIYSSGTTGEPKGIAHTHGGRRDWAYDLSITLRYHGNTRFLATIGLYSNISWVGMLCTLLAGGTIYIADKFDAKRLWAQIERDHITHLCMVPIMYQRMMDVENHEDHDASSLYGLMSAGSPLHAPLRKSLFERFPRGITELYGLTEGVITTLEPEDADGRLSSVGLPLIGTDLMILDNNDRPCPPHQAGEIIATGRIMMPGYLHRPEATRDALYTDVGGRHWLRTGDIGYLDDEGYLYIVDRKKDMILSGGQNIYPQDIEAVLITHPDIADVAVIGAKSTKWGETPLALVVPVAGHVLKPDTVKSWCNAKLGKQQRIADVRAVDDIPRNPNGKILKRELRKQFKDVSYD